jgi:hypothetical protein
VAPDLHEDLQLLPGEGEPRAATIAQAFEKSFAHIAAFRKWNALIPNSGRIGGATDQLQIFKELFESSLSYSRRMRHAPCITPVAPAFFASSPP